jgi:nucleoside-diphosphate-sugar epimerase
MIEVNASGTGRLFSRFRNARAFVYTSSASAYAYQGGRPLVEEDPYGLQEGLEDYAISKIGAEILVGFLAEEWAVPTTILRVFSMYGPRGGTVSGRVDRIRDGSPVTIYPERENRVTVMHEDDYVEKLMTAATVASVPPVVTNFGGSSSSIEEYCSLAATMLNTTVTLVPSLSASTPREGDLSRMRDLLGSTRITVEEGIRRIVEGGDGERLDRWRAFAIPGEGAAPEHAEDHE